MLNIDITNIAGTTVERPLCEKTIYDVDDIPETRRIYGLLSNMEYNTDNLEENAFDLKIQKVKPKSTSKGRYDKIKNVLSYTDEAYLTHELFHVASSNKKESGIRKGDNYRGLNEGITDFFASNLDKRTKVEYPFEKICAEILYKIYQKEVFAPYFETNVNKFFNQFKEDKLTMINFANQLDEYTSTIEKVCDMESANEAKSKLIRCLKTLSKLYIKEKECDINEYENYVNKLLNRNEMNTIRMICDIYGKISFSNEPSL